MKFGENLKSLRNKKNITQEELAEKIGVSRQSVSKWECAESYPTMDNILELCKIFNCKINDLVHEDLVDLKSLDEEIIVKVTKLSNLSQRKVKGVSKAIYIIARICRIFTIIGIVSVILALIITPIISKNIELKNIGELEIFDKKVEYVRKDNEITITYKGKSTTLNKREEVFTLNEILEVLENDKLFESTILIELAYFCLIISLILLHLTFKKLEKLFINIHDGVTPFTKENIGYIKSMALLMVLTIIIPNISGILVSLIIKKDLGIGFELFDFIYILFLISMAYIFEYGYEIQLDSKGKMYD